MPVERKGRWTLRTQLRAIIISATVSMLLLGGLSTWRIRQFNQRENALQQTAIDLQDNLKNNFANTQLLREIEAGLPLYMHSGKTDTFNNILSKINTLQHTLSAEIKDQVQTFRKKLLILQKRTGDLRGIDDEIFRAERNIVQATDRLLQSAGAQFIFQIQNLTSDTCLKHHHLYNTVLLTSEPKKLQRTVQEYEALFNATENELKNIAQQLPAEQQKFIDNILENFSDLKQTVTTIINIRGETLATKNEIEKIIVDIKTNIASASITQAESSSTTMDSVLRLARNNLIFMAISLVLAAFMLALIALLLNQSMVKPLLAFSDLLQKMTRILTGLRKESEFEGEFSDLLTSMTDGRQDEIGQVATAIENLLKRLRELAVFRQAVEADDTSDEIYQRLARTFYYKLHLKNFIIFEALENKKEMVSILRHLEDNFQGIPEVSLNEDCRARRTGAMVSSFSDPHTCSFFPLGEQIRYVCVPMQVSGQVIGVVQFVFLPGLSEEKQRNALQALTQARHYIAEALPVLQAKRLANRLKIMATEDQLTGLYNRHYLENNLDRMVSGIKRRNSSICVLMCDLDHFKDVNDTYGHDAGDKVLIQLAKILLNAVREADMVIRFGGEEFMILLLDSGQETSREMAERIRKEVQQYKFRIPGHTIRMTMSIGIANFPEAPDQGIWEAFKLADIALYHAKEEGRNRVVQFDHALLHRSKKETSVPEDSINTQAKDGD